MESQEVRNELLTKVMDAWIKTPLFEKLRYINMYDGLCIYDFVRNTLTLDEFEILSEDFAHSYSLLCKALFILEI